MSYEDLKQLQYNDKVFTTQWGEAYVKNAVNESDESRKENRRSVELFKFSIPNIRCKWYTNEEIITKL